ncbi:Ribosomal RNA-processing protein 7-like A [Holothuria leucospilota]|uniref:Ribosomal RNA-processing protein 7-like A n=1 Tax=Holothuria leucospilota TaxID=206669 RepID=A0A9Q1H5Z6_HOLLE|nr:Ribosomal RNA-processing protein 7-like A [Holothuria leucospilota]
MAREINLRKFDAVQVQFSDDNTSAHYLFFRRHLSKEEDLRRPADRTLFVANVPPYCNEACLQRLFGDIGKVESVYREETSVLLAKESEQSKTESHGVNQVYSVAFIIYTDSKELEKSIKELCQVKMLKADVTTMKTGLAKWCSEYAANRPNPQKLQKEVDNFMLNYDKEKKKEEEEAKEKEGMADEDGWVTVTKKTKKKVVQRTEQKQEWLKAKEAKKAKQREHVNFYAFQMKQSKRDYIADLRRKFEEDKQKIAAMKAARRFKPY